MSNTIIQNSFTVLQKCIKQCYTYFVSSLFIFSIIEKNFVFKDKIDKTNGFYLINNNVLISAFPLITALPLKNINTLFNYLY